MSTTMPITCTITTAHPHGTLKRLFATELAREHERSSVTLEDYKGNGAFRITANDTTALRAAFNTITSTLTIYEKTKEATDGTTGRH